VEPAAPAELVGRIVREALESFVKDLASGSWTGRREREAVSLFVMGHLALLCQEDKVLHDPTQIGIEVPVPQITTQRELSGSSRSKAQVCKDIVIWPRPRMTCWDSDGRPTIRPLSILEWKHNEPDTARYDVDWLKAFSGSDPNFVGFAVSTRSSAWGPALWCTRVYLGQQEDGWLRIGEEPVARIPPELWEAYQRTTFQAETPMGQIRIVVGQNSEVLDTLLAQLGCDSYAYITAFNPGSVVLAAEENLRRHDLLRERVAAGGWHSFEGHGVSEREPWPPEKSLLILGIPHAYSIELGRSFGQLAIVIGERGSRAKLAAC
jgi:hypothetical protein